MDHQSYIQTMIPFDSRLSTLSTYRLFLCSFIDARVNDCRADSKEEPVDRKILMHKEVLGITLKRDYLRTSLTFKVKKFF